MYFCLHAWCSWELTFSYKGQHSDPSNEGNSPLAVKIKTKSDSSQTLNTLPFLSTCTLWTNSRSLQSEPPVWVGEPQNIISNTFRHSHRKWKSPLHGTRYNPSDEEETSGDSSDSSLVYWDYVTDPCYSTDEIPFSASQPCGYMRGVSYTPPGWMRKPKARKCTKKSKPPAAKRMNLDK